MTPLTEETIAELTALTHGYRARGDVLGSYVAGSVAEGYANSTSDVDLVVVTWSAPVVDQPAPARLSNDGARLVEVELVPVDAYQHTDSELLNGLRIGIPVTGATALAELRSRIGWTAVREDLLHALRRSVLESTEDAEGAIADGSAYTARCCSRLALDASVDSLTVSLGDLSTKPKWRMHRIDRLGLTEVGQSYLRADIESAPAGPDALAAARVRLDLAHRFLSHPTLTRSR